MSIAALADEEILRTDRRNLDVRQIIAPRLNSVVAKFGLDAQATTELNTALEPVASDSPIKKTAASSAIDGLAKYIPTESITLYVAATAAWSSLHNTFPSLTLLQLYWGFVVLTPVLFLLVYLGKRRSQGLPLLPELPWQWPWWKLIASTIAFMVWALAILPLVDIDGNVVAGFGALIVSTLLSLVGAVVEPPEKTDGK
jgi:hypothetical protein